MDRLKYIHILDNGDKIICNPENQHIFRVYKNAGNIKVNYEDKMTNDENQDLCGGWRIIDNIPFEETHRVMQGLKPVGISHSWNKNKVDQKIQEYEEKGFLVSRLDRLKHGSKDETLYGLTVSPKGKLSDYFNFKVLIDDYIKNGLGYDAKKLKEYENVNFEAFHNGKFDKEDHPFCVVGLILGYPIENTISILKYE